MYKIINVTDREGNVKEKFMEELEVMHPGMCGKLLYPITKELMGMIRMCFIWTDNSDKVLRTSIIEDYEVKGNIVTVTTANSIYTLERMD